MGDFICLSFEISIQLFFFPLLFSDYFCSIDPRVVYIVSGGCNQFSSTHFMKYSSRCIDASTLSLMLVSPLPSSFLDAYSLSTSSLGCKALCIVISLLVLWSICLSSSLVYFMNGPEYFTRETTQVYIFFDEVPAI